jgi:hypothetical protein
VLQQGLEIKSPAPAFLSVCDIVARALLLIIKVHPREPGGSESGFRQPRFTCFQCFAHPARQRISGTPIALIRCVQSLWRRLKMKSITSRFFVFAATAMFLGTTFGQTTAFGQTTLRADVPFAFHVSGGGANAGNYAIQLENGLTGKVITVYNNDSHRSALAITFPLFAKPGAAIHPRLVFRCGDTGCALSEIWTADGGYGIPQGKSGAHDYLASIPLTVRQGN